MNKDKDFSVKELTRREIMRVNAAENATKYKKDNSRYKKVIAGYRENEKKLQAYCFTLKQKLNNLKENTIGSLFTLSENISDIKKSYTEFCDGYSDSILRDNLKSFCKEFDYITDYLMNVCNTIEMNSTIKNIDEKTISNVNNVANKTVNNTVLTDNEDDFEWDFNSSTKQNVADNQIASEKIKKIFYEAPENSGNKPVNGSSVGLSKNYNGLFDFDEALNPTMSLNDIMADLMQGSDKESKMVSSSSLSETADEEDENNNYEAWFMSLQNIIQNETKRKK